MRESRVELAGQMWYEVRPSEERRSKWKPFGLQCLAPAIWPGIT